MYFIYTLNITECLNYELGENRKDLCFHKDQMDSKMVSIGRILIKKRIFKVIIEL